MKDRYCADYKDFSLKHNGTGKKPGVITKEVGSDISNAWRLEGEVRLSEEQFSFIKEALDTAYKQGQKDIQNKLQTLLGLDEVFDRIL